jgi:NADH-quinone oxidoreductase subunit N
MHSLLAFTAPEIILVGTLVVLVVVDAFTERDRGWAASSIAGLGLLGALIPCVTLADNGEVRALFGGAYVVDDFALVFKALFVVAAYVVVLLSTNYVAEGDLWEGEYYQLLLASVLGMLVMSSARDLISVFVALELLSIPAYMLAAWRKRDLRSEEAGIKYYLMGVFATAVLLYGMSLLFGITGSTLLTDVALATSGSVTPLLALAITFVVVGFGFKVSAVPFHTWAPDTYQGAPTPVTAFLAVSSKAAGFVALLTVVGVAFPNRSDVVEPLLWVLAALTMVVGNTVALRQTNVVRLLAYSGIAQAGYMLAPLAVAGATTDGLNQAMSSVATYLWIYMAMNLGAFAVVIAVARRTNSAELADLAGLHRYAPGLAWSLVLFVFSLAGIPPLAGWFAKFNVFSALVSADTTAGYALAVLVGMNSVIALFYYARIARVVAIDDPADGTDLRPLKVPVSLWAAVAITLAITLVVGAVPEAVGHFTGGDALLSLPTVGG